MHPAASRGVPPSGGTGAVRQAVAVVLTWNGRVGLFKRSRAVAHDGGRWHCVTGLVPHGGTPFEQALVELAEETGVSIDTIECLIGGPVLELAHDEDDQVTWTVHTFVARVTQRRLELDWEHDSYRWVRPRDVPRFEGQVPWLRDVLEAVAEHLPGRP